LPLLLPLLQLPVLVAQAAVVAAKDSPSQWCLPAAAAAAVVLVAAVLQLPTPALALLAGRPICL
jgi:hypothetical protein